MKRLLPYSKRNPETQRKLGLVRCFAADLTAIEAAKKTGFSRITVNKYYKNLRLIICDNYKKFDNFDRIYNLCIKTYSERLFKEALEALSLETEYHDRGSYIIRTVSSKKDRDIDAILFSKLTQMLFGKEVNKTGDLDRRTFDYKEFKKRERLPDYLEKWIEDSENTAAAIIEKNAYFYNEDRVRYLKRGVPKKHFEQYLIESKYRFLVNRYHIIKFGFPHRHKKNKREDGGDEIRPLPQNSLLEHKEKDTSLIYADLVSWIRRNPVHS